MEISVSDVHPLRFADGSAVRAASAVTWLSDSWLIAQDDATHAAVWTEGPAQALRLFDPVAGADTFSSDEGTKDSKPDLEAACTVDGRLALLLGSGSLPNRMRGAAVRGSAGAWEVGVRDLSPLYDRVAGALGVTPAELNLEGACITGERLRWFQRGHANGIASASVDLELGALMAAFTSRADVDEILIERVRHYNLPDVDGVPLAVTDAVTLPDGRILVSAAAEDAPDAVADGPVVGTALALLDDDRVVASQRLPDAPDGGIWKAEGLGLYSGSGASLRLLAVVDQDDAAAASLALLLDVRL